MSNEIYKLDAPTIFLYIGGLVAIPFFTVKIEKASVYEFLIEKTDSDILAGTIDLIFVTALICLSLSIPIGLIHLYQYLFGSKT